MNEAVASSAKGVQKVLNFVRWLRVANAKVFKRGNVVVRIEYCDLWGRHFSQILPIPVTSKEILFIINGDIYWSYKQFAA